MPPESFFEPGEGRPTRVRELFSKIARRYDFINDVQSFGLHRYWKRRVIKLAVVQPGARALDLCCGTGDLALELARRGARVVGLDFTGPMLEIAQQRSKQSIPDRDPGKSKPGKLTLVRADAQRLPFAENSFDIVTVGYGLRNLASWEHGLRGMLRVAAPGARIVALEFGKPANPGWRMAYFAYLRLIVPLFGLIFCGDAKAYAYILESLRHYPAQQEVAVKMRELGYHDVQVKEFLGGVMSINFGVKK